jgi:putative tricarboxylic transport membrane protein
MTEAQITHTEKQRDWPGMIYAGFFVVIGVFAVYFTRDMSPLGAVFPKTIALALIIFSLSYIAQNLISPGSVQRLTTEGSWLRRTALVVVMLAWVLLLNTLGFLLAGVLGFIGMILAGNYDAWSRRRVLIYAAVSAAIIGGFYTLFAIVLNVPLPEASWL